MYDVPFNKRSVTIVRVIGNNMGFFISFDEFISMRIWVFIDNLKLLVKGMKIVSSYGDTKWVDIKYERLFLFCFICGKVGYVNRDCFNNDDEGGDDIEYR